MSFDRLMTCLLAGSLVFGPALGSAADVSPTLVRQVRKDFAEGKIGFEKETFARTLDPQTFTDLGVQSLIDVITKFAPSRLSKDRLAWLLTNPSLDARQINLRQRAARMIAEDEELFALLAEAFEVRQYGGVVGKVNAFVRDSVGLSRKSFANGLPNPGFLSLSTAGRGLLVALMGFFQYGFVERAVESAQDPTVHHVANAVLSFGFLAGSSLFYRFHLPLVEAKRRAKQLRHIVNAPEFTVEKSTLLIHYKNLCDELKDDAARARVFGAPMPIGRTLETITRFFGMSPYLSFPASCNASAQPVSVVAVTGLMADLEALYTVAKIYRAHRNQLTFPTVHKDIPTLKVTAGAHPVLFFEKEPSVANPLDSQEGGVKTHVFTGPNTGGKTTFQAGNMLNAILAMAGLPVPAQAMELTPAYILTSSSQSHGSVEQGTSTYRAQARRISDLFHFVRDPKRKYPVFLILDEILTGTTGEERRAYERSTTRLMHREPGVLTIIATHDRSLTHLAEQIGLVEGWGMDNIRVTLHGHEVVPGASTDYNAIDLMKDEGAHPVLLANTNRYLEKSLAREACDQTLRGTK